MQSVAGLCYLQETDSSLGKRVVYQLTLCQGTQRGASWPVGERTLVVGRGRECDVCVPDPLVSRRHCEVQAADGGIRVRDLGSANATLVNGAPVQETVARVGDELTVGGQVFVVSRVQEVRAPRSVSEKEGVTPMTRALSEVYYVSDPLERLPEELSRSGQEFRDLFALGRRFSRLEHVAELIDALVEELERRFRPDGLWFARYLPGSHEFIFEPLSREQERADEIVVRELPRAIEANAGIILPRWLAQGNGRRFCTLMVAPLSVGEDRVGGVALQRASGREMYDGQDLEMLVAVAHTFAPYLRAAESREQLKRDYEALREATGSSTHLIGENPVIGEVRGLIARAAPTRLNVLITGETGTGKEVAARMVHDLSPRSRGPFVAVNCAAIPKELFESEIFGHEKGAFTGASRRRVGHFEEAHGGTLLLDEVGDLSPDNQARLLRVLETGTFYPLGSEKPVQCDVRIVSSTNRPLQALAERREFRLDLYHRLSGFEIFLPALRDRASDVEVLARHFLDSMGSRMGHGPLKIGADALEKLKGWHWPGNVRELKACMERAAALCQGGVIRAGDIVLQGAVTVSVSTPESEPEGSAECLKLTEAEKNHIARVLRLQQGNLNATARALGITRLRLARKMQEYGIE